MRLRCPHGNCPLDLPDDSLGVEIRCPHCGNPFTVGPQHRDLTLDDDHPAASAVDTQTDTTPIQHRLYDGLPPLSVMMAIRAGKPLDDRAALAMTPDDWNALAAYEVLVGAQSYLAIAWRTAAISFFMHFVLMIFHLTSGTRPHRISEGDNLGISVAFTAAIGVLAWLLRTGTFSLSQLDIHGKVTEFVPWLAFAGCFLMPGATYWLFNSMNIYYGGFPESVNFLTLVVDFCALVPMALACWHSMAALDRIAPPEILKRLQDALAYLD